MKDKLAFGKYKKKWKIANVKYEKRKLLCYLEAYIPYAMSVRVQSIKIIKKILKNSTNTSKKIGKIILRLHAVRKTPLRK